MDLQKQKELKTRILDFNRRVSVFVVCLPNTPSNRNAILQLIRCVSSIGANYQEACAGESVRDFLHKMTICKKGAQESNYWLLLLSESNPKLKIRMANLLQESEEIVKIFGKAVSTTRIKYPNHN